MRYQLDENEMALNCKKLTGRMQLRTLEIRDYATKPKTSDLSRGMQSLLAPLISGPKVDQDEAGRYARDVAILEAYNKRLVELKCPAFDLNAELQPHPVAHTPEPQAAKSAAR